MAGASCPNTAYVTHGAAEWRFRRDRVGHEVISPSLTRLPHRRRDAATVSRERAQREITNIVREQLLLGSERRLPLDVPLGELGLDSLAVLYLVAAVEGTLGVELSEDFLTRRGPISLQDLIEAAVTGRPIQPTGKPVRPGKPTIPPHHRMERLQHALAGRGPLGAGARAAATVGGRAERVLFKRTRHYLLERRLDGREQSAIETPPGVDLRPYRASDDADLAGVWPDFDEKRSRCAMERWLDDGAVALVAAQGSRVVAVDLLSADGDRGEVELAPSRGACWGLHLTEAPDVRGRGIGLALLAYSLRVAEQLGFVAQITAVRDDNAPMLTACVQLLGFRQLGIARRTRILGITRWSWEIDGLRQRGPRLSL